MEHFLMKDFLIERYTFSNAKRKLELSWIRYGIVEGYSDKSQYRCRWNRTICGLNWKDMPPFAALDFSWKIYVARVSAKLETELVILCLVYLFKYTDTIIVYNMTDWEKWVQDQIF